MASGTSCHMTTNVRRPHGCEEKGKEHLQTPAKAAYTPGTVFQTADKACEPSLRRLCKVDQSSGLLLEEKLNPLPIHLCHCYLLLALGQKDEEE